MTANSMVERYLTGRLPEEQRREFEDHYAACDACFADVEALSAVRNELRSMPRTRTRRSAAAWPWALAAAAGITVIGLAVFEMRPHVSPHKAPEIARVNAYAELAQLDPPAWTDVRYRDAAERGDASVRTAREAYARHDWKLCSASLGNASVPETEFYLAICRLAAGDAAGATAPFRKLIAAGDTPFLEEAHYYLAKALLAQDDPAGARNELGQAVALHGDLERLASDLLARFR